jgi:hypothetical protein
MYLKKKTILTLFYGFLLISLAYHMLRQIYAGYSIESWNITEFLINYRGGFVRRGLIGEIILWIYHSLGWSPYYVIMGISFFSYILLGGFFLYHFIKRGYTLFFFPFIFFLGNPVFNDFWVRKDCLLLLFFICSIYFLVHGGKWKLIWVNVFSILGILCHESLAFFLIPVLALYLYHENKAGSKHPIGRTFLSLLPIFSALVSVILYSGNWTTVSQIWNSWKDIPFPIEPDVKYKIPAAIHAISWPFNETVELVKESVFGNFKYHIYAPLVWIIAFFLTYWILSNTEKVRFPLFLSEQKQIDKPRISNFLIFQWMTLIPIFVIGADYGRWIFYWTASSFALFILSPAEKAEDLFPEFISQIRIKINQVGNAVLGETSIVFLSLLVGFNRFYFDAFEVMQQTAGILILQNISKIIFYLFTFLPV